MSTFTDAHICTLDVYKATPTHAVVVRHFLENDSWDVFEELKVDVPMFPGKPDLSDLVDKEWKYSQKSFRKFLDKGLAYEYAEKRLNEIQAQA